MLAVLALYARTARHEFVSFDDPSYVSANPQVQAGLGRDSVVWAFTTTHASNWHPLTWLSHMADVEAFGLDAGAHHLVSAGLHAAASLVLFLAFVGLTGDVWRSAFVAAAFALHPLHVESVAWVAERKDVLAGLCFALALLAWARWARAGSTAAWAAALACTALALLAKPTVVTLPFVLLLLDVWPLRRSALGARRLLREKLPFFALAAASSVITWFVQAASGAVKTLDAAPLAARLENLPVAYAWYLWKTVWPSGLGVFYPVPATRSLALVAAASALLVAITAVAWRERRRRPWLIVGWLWFAGMLVPMSGIVRVGAHAYADRYAYLPSLGLFLAAAFAVRPATARARAAAGVAAVALLASWSAIAFVQLGHWRDSAALWQRALEVSPGNYLALSKLGTLAIAAGRTDEAIAQLEAALAAKPDHAVSHTTLAAALERAGRADDARRHLERALELEPGLAPAHFNLANLLVDAEPRAALDHYRAALRAGLELPAVHQGMALAHERLGEPEAAARERDAAARLESR